MAGTIKTGMALVLVCTVVRTVNCRSLYSPNVDQLSVDERDSPRVRRNLQGWPGATIDDNFPSPSVTSRPGLGAGKLLCRQVLNTENTYTRCDDNEAYGVQWNRRDDNKTEIWIYKSIAHGQLVDGTHPSARQC